MCEETGEGEEKREKERGREGIPTEKGRNKRKSKKGALYPEQWWFCIVKGCQIPATHYVSSYLFLLAGTTRPRALPGERERETESERGGRER